MPTRHDLQPLGAHGHENDEPVHTPTPPEHTPEPWIAGDNAIAGADGATVAYIGSVADGDRIVACVNALAGVDDPAVALAEIRAALVDARDRLAGMTGVADPLPRVRAALALLGEGGSPS